MEALAIICCEVALQKVRVLQMQSMHTRVPWRVIRYRQSGRPAFAHERWDL